MNKTELIKKAIKARNFAYAPYSNFKVGAALLTKEGEVFCGCNVENASFGATVCAERAALFSAVSKGEREFSMLAIASDRDEPCFPCGICRQALFEFSPDMTVLCASPGGEYEEHTLRELLPGGFRL